MPSKTTIKDQTFGDFHFHKIDARRLDEVEALACWHMENVPVVLAKGHFILSFVTCEMLKMGMPTSAFWNVDARTVSLGSLKITSNSP